MVNWKKHAIQILEDSLYPVPSELNELDWKSGLSCKTERLAQHICAFSNLKGGGVLVFGVNNDATMAPLTQQEMEKTLQTLGNIARNNLCSSVSLEHAVLDYKGNTLLFVHIPEYQDKPMHLRGKDIYESYTRSAGQTTKMSRTQIKSMIAESQGKPYEKRIAKEALDLDEVLSLLDYNKLFERLEKEVPPDKSTVMRRMEEYGLCVRNNYKWDITNMGAILFANNMSDFEGMQQHAVVVRKYVGTNNRDMLFEQIGNKGYVVGFEGLIHYVVKQTSTESIGVVRKMIPSYPTIAIREFIANALVHQDFSMEGMRVTVEIFSNRIAITNPGAPLNDVNRLLDLPPHSRNEDLAQTMFLLGLCERRGSGIDRAVESIEQMLLPAAKITKGESFTRVFLFPKKPLSEMTKTEKIDACYQHACLMYEENKSINNKSIRERFGIDKNNSAVASRIISDTLESGKIKLSDENMTTRKFATYIPYYG